VALDPNSFSALYRHGVILQRLSQFEEAVAAFKSALIMAPHNAAIIHRRLAESFERCGQDAMAFHHRALSLRVKRPRALPGLSMDWPDQFLPIE
jgi:tetratricopeptide (TPR) repeat protein